MRRDRIGVPSWPSIAVLPFRAPNENPEEAYFSEGMVDDIIFTLSRACGDCWSSRAPPRCFIANGPTDLQKIGQELGCQLCSERERAPCRQQAADQRGTVACRKLGSVIWTDRYDGDLANLFVSAGTYCQRASCGAIAPHVRETRAEARDAKTPREYGMPYDLLMRAIDLLYRMTPLDFVQGGKNCCGGAHRRGRHLRDGLYAYAALWQVSQHQPGLDHQSASGFNRGSQARRRAAVDRDPR